MSDRDRITLDFGDGGRHSQNLLKEVFLQSFRDTELAKLDDAACLASVQGRLALTTDSFVVNPLFFPGGDIGKLAVTGTVNDLAVSGAVPLYLTVGFIIEEGFSRGDLQKIVCSMAREAEESGVKIVAGDTKVVEKNKGDGLFINTAGVGVLIAGASLGCGNVVPGDAVFINGTIGLHGLSILSKRQGIEFETGIESDCASLQGLIKGVLNCFKEDIKFMRDPTRGGVATTLLEIAEAAGVDIVLEEEMLPVGRDVQGGCDLLGLDPLYLANEGKVVLIAKAEKKEEILSYMQNHPLGKDACIIGRIQPRDTEEKRGRVVVETFYGATRELDYLHGLQLPRIC